MELTVILPIFNEVANVAPLLEEIRDALEPIGKTYEIVAVDDGSRDGSSQLLRQLSDQNAHLKVLFFRHNCGQAAAFDAGFRHAQGNVIVTMDADRQNDPRDISALIAKLDEGYDLVTGWRKNRRDTLLLRKVPSRIANWLIRRVTGTEAHDLGCSLKVYRRHVTDELRLYGEMHRFISVIAESQGARVGEVVVSHRPRVAGTSKYGLRRSVKVMLDLATVMFMRRYQTKPIYVFGGLGILSFFDGSFLCAVVLWEKWAEGVWVHRNPLFLIAVVCFLTAFQFMGSGIVAEMIMRTYYESQNKTAYSLASRVGFDREP